MSGSALRYASFVVRVWQHVEPRVDVEHIQTGDRMRAVSLADVAAWMDRIASGPVGAEPSAPVSEER